MLLYCRCSDVSSRGSSTKLLQVAAVRCAVVTVSASSAPTTNNWIDCLYDESSENLFIFSLGLADKLKPTHRVVTFPTSTSAARRRTNGRCIYMLTYALRPRRREHATGSSECACARASLALWLNSSFAQQRILLVRFISVDRLTSSSVHWLRCCRRCWRRQSSVNSVTVSVVVRRNKCVYYNVATRLFPFHPLSSNSSS